MNKDYEVRFYAALDFAKVAGETALNYYQDPNLKIELKRDSSVVTAADRRIEVELRSLIAKHFPEDSVIGEEGDNTDALSSSPAGFQWILDPIDGTQSFVCGVPLFGTLIGITHNGDPVIGVCGMPAIQELYYGVKGEGAWLKAAHLKVPSKIQVSKATDLKQSLFSTTSRSGFERINRTELFDRLLDSTKKFRGWGSCYGHMLVARGSIDLMVEPEVKIWDCAALYPIVTEAGGEFFALNGEARIDRGSAISCAPGLSNSLKLLLQS